MAQILNKKIDSVIVNSIILIYMNNINYDSVKRRKKTKKYKV